MEYYKVREIYPWLYSIKEMDVFCYLLVGQESALLFDAAYGVFDLRGVVEGITDKPYTVVLGHGHIDHVNAATQFDSVMLHPADYKLYDEHSGEDFRRGLPESAKAAGYPVPDEYDIEAFAKSKQTKVEPLEIGRVFDLGGLHVEVIGMAGHTAGSVGLLVREHAVLLTSDSANSHVWLFLEESLPLNTYIAMLERVEKLPFTSVFVGHSEEQMDKSIFQKYITVAKNADVEKSEPYAPFGEESELKGWLYQEGDVAIVFNPDKIDGA